MRRSLTQRFAATLWPGATDREQAHLPGRTELRVTRLVVMGIDEFELVQNIAERRRVSDVLLDFAWWTKGNNGGFRQFLIERGHSFGGCPDFLRDSAMQSVESLRQNLRLSVRTVAPASIEGVD